MRDFLRARDGSLVARRSRPQKQEPLFRMQTTALVVGAAAEAANQVSDSEGDSGSRVRALLDGCTQEVVGLAGTFADGVRGVGRRLLRLSVDILQCALHLPGLALELRFYIAGRASESLFHLAAEVLGVTGQAIFIHVFLLRVTASTAGGDVGSLPSLKTRTDDFG